MSNGGKEQGKVATILSTRGIPGKFSKEMLPLWGVLFPAVVVSMTNGFDNSQTNGLQNLPYFYESPARPDVKPSFPELSIGVEGAAYFGNMVSMWGYGGILTMFIIPIFLDRMGRRGAMVVGSIINLVSTIICATAFHYAQFCVGRFMLGVGVGIVSTAAPTYVAEMAHPAHRGFMTGFYNCWWNVGALLCEIIITGTIHIESEWSWRIPVICMGIPSIVTIIGCFFLPESPRWLVAKGRTKEAAKVLGKYHCGGNSEDELVVAQIEEIVENIENEKESGLGKTWKDLFNYVPLFKTRSARYRAFCLFIQQFMMSFVGGSFGYFTVLFNRLAGITDPATLQYLTLGGQAYSSVISIFGSFFVDILGRRRMLLIFLAGWYTVMLLQGSLLKAIQSNSEDWEGRTPVAVAYVTAGYIGSTVWCFFFTPLQALIPVELFNNVYRARGLSLGTLFYNIAVIFNNYVVPIAVTTIKENIYFTYLALGVVIASFVYFFMPETKGRTLEELDEIFEAPNPRKASLTGHFSRVKVPIEVPHVEVKV